MAWWREGCVLGIGAVGQLDDFEVGGDSCVDGEEDEGALAVPTVVAGGSGIDVEEVEARIVHHLEDVAMAAYHESGFALAQTGGHPWGVAAGISTDVGEEHL